MAARSRHLTPIFALLLPLACASIIVGVGYALDYSQDLQWDEARLFLDGINPYRFYFDPDLELPNYIIPENLGLTQPPSAVLLFAPIALPSFEAAKLIWILVNFLATIGFVLLSTRLFVSGTHKFGGLTVLTLLLIVSMPWRITIGNGQYGLVAMTLFLIALHFFRERRLGLTILFSSLALVKYPLVLPFFALFLHRKRDTALVLSGAFLVHAVLTVLAGYLVGERPDILIRQSLTIAASVSKSGAYDFFAFQARIAPELGRTAPILLSALTIAATIALFWKEAGLRELAALSIVSLVIVYHRSYDAFVLFFLVLHLHALSLAASPWSRRAGLLGLVEFWTGCAVLLYVFLLDQFVYGLGGREIHESTNAAFSALLYAYLFFLFFRAFRARALGADGRPGMPAAAAPS